MINANLLNIEGLLKGNFIKVSISYPMTKKSHFKLADGVSIILSNKDVIDIPKGFLFDGSSSPRFLWWLFPSYGDFFFAALIHDYLYHIRYYEKEIGSQAAQKFADEEMLKWSNLINDRHIGKIVDNYFRYFAVRLFGKKKFTT